MLFSDIAISAGGQTIYELARLGVPTIAIKTADNQSTNIKGLMFENALLYVGRLKEKSFLKNISASIKEMNNYKIRKSFSEKSSSLIDGRGVDRIIKKIMETVRC